MNHFSCLYAASYTSLMLTLTMTFNKNKKYSIKHHKSNITIDYWFKSGVIIETVSVHICQFYVSRSCPSFLLGSTEMHESSHHRNIFLSLSPQPTHSQLQRCTQPWVFIPPSLRMKVCWLLQMLTLHWWKLFHSKRPFIYLSLNFYLFITFHLCAQFGCMFSQNIQSPDCILSVC